MRSILNSLETWQARLVAGLAMMAALVNFMPPTPGWAPDPGKGIAFAVALLAWLTVTIKGAATPLPHDVRLFTKLTETVSPAERTFLRSHDFLGSFALGQIAGVREVGVHWEGSSYAFLDKSLQREWGPIKLAIDEFRDLVAGTTSPVRGNVQLQTVRTLLEQEQGGISDRTRDEARAMNTVAAKISELLDAFEATGHRRLRV